MSLTCFYLVELPGIEPGYRNRADLRKRFT